MNFENLMYFDLMTGLDTFILFLLFKGFQIHSASWNSE